MIKLLNKCFIISILSVFITGNALSQSVCLDKLNLAKQLFESGQIEQIPSLLDSCLEKGFSRDEKIIAYHLLIQTYLFDYNQSKADETMTRFLNEFPNYRLQETDPAEIKELFETFIVQPTWSFEVVAGGNISHIITKQYYSTSNLELLQNTIKAGFGFNAGLQATRYFGKHFAASLGAKYVNSNYKITEEINDGRVQSAITEKTSWVAVPISFQGYLDINRKVSPFVYAGMEFSYILNSMADLKTKYNFSGNSQIAKGTGFDFTDNRNTIQYCLSGGIGVKCKLSKGSLKCWAGYNYSLISFASEASRYQDIDKILYYQHIDDDFLYDHIFINASYSVDLYRIRKK